MQTFPVYSYVGPVEMESVSNVTATNSVQLGEVRFFGGEEYVYVYNAGATGLTAGQYAVLSANSGYSVTGSSVTMFDFPLGWVKHTAIPNGQYGWLMTRGFVTALGQSNISWAVSDLLFPGSGGRVANATNQISFICGLIYNPVGQCLSAGATIGASTGLAFLAYVRGYGT